MKKLSPLIKATGTLLLLTSLIPSVFAAENPFKDVVEGDSHFVAIQYLKDQKLINGYEDGTFRADKNVNRAEALKILLTAIPRTKIQLSQQTPIPGFNFPDVQKNDWFYETVKSAFQNQIIEGYSDKLFHPERDLNRAESLKIVLLEAKTRLPKTVDTSPYSDVPLTSWFINFAQVSK